MRPISLLALALSLLIAPGLALAQKDDPLPFPDYGEKVGSTPDALDPYLEKIVGNLTLFQEAFEKQYGTFAQSLDPYAKETIPADGFALFPDADKQSKYPTAGIAVDDFYLVAGLEAFPASVRMDVYAGPQGKGWVLVAVTKFSNRLWQRTLNVGPEAHRNTNWQEVTESGQ